MTRTITLLSFLLAGTASLTAQWQATTPPFATIDPSVGVNNFSMVTQDIIWSTPYGDLAYAAVSTDGGDTWSANPLGNGTAGSQPSWIHGRSATEAWAVVGEAARVLHTTNGGANWTNAMPTAWTELGAYPNHIHFFDAQNGIVLGDPVNGNWEIYKTSDGGSTWTPVTGLPAPLVQPAPNGIETSTPKSTFVKGDNVWFGTKYGRVYRSGDRGLTWSVSETGMTIVHSLQFQDGMTGFANRFGVIKKTIDGGTTWNDHTDLGTMPSYWYSNVPSTNAWVSTGWGSIFGTAQSVDGGLTWSSIDASRGRQISFWNNTTGYLAGSEGGALSFFRWVGSPFELSTSVNEMRDEIGVSFYPNPSADAITITGVGSMTTAAIYTTTGQLVMQRLVGDNSTLTLNELVPGAYILELLEGDRVRRSHLVKQ